jgi:hypothetical protein
LRRTKECGTFYKHGELRHYTKSEELIQRRQVGSNVDWSYRPYHLIFPLGLAEVEFILLFSAFSIGTEKGNFGCLWA